VTNLEHQHDLAELIEALDSDNHLDRILAIRILSDIGDANSLDYLRSRLGDVSQEYAALVAAVKTLQTRLES
jgi:HEAT repeat protein